MKRAASMAVIRQTVVVAALVLLPWSAGAQIQRADGPKIRFSGPNVYEMPGEALIERGRVTGTAIEKIETTFVQVRSAAAGRVVTIPRPGERLEGRVISVDPTVVSVRLDGVSRPVLVPHDAIEELEVSTGRRHSRGLATALGIAAGFAGFLGGGAVAFSLCDSFPDCDAVPLAGLAVGVTLGGYTANRLAGERWEPMTLASLSKRLAPAVP